MAREDLNITGIDPHNLETIHIDSYREIMEGDNLLWVDHAGFLVCGEGIRIAANKKQFDALIEFLNEQRRYIGR